MLESSHTYDANKWLNIGFGDERTLIEAIEINCMHLIWSSDGDFHRFD